MSDTLLNDSSFDSPRPDLDTDDVDEYLHGKFQVFNATLLQTHLRSNFKEQYTAIKPAIEKYGVNEEQLTLLSDVIFSNKLNTAPCKQLLDLCLPRGPLKCKHIVRIFRYLPMRQTRKKSRSQRNIGYIEITLLIPLLKWAITMYDFVDDTEELGKFYGVLFHYLTLVSLRPYLCHLLQLMTRKQHVKSYRIQKLLEIGKVTGFDPPLASLLNTYKTYHPDLVFPATQKLANFEVPCPHIKARCLKIQAIWKPHEVEEYDDTAFRPQVEPRGTKRGRKAEQLMNFDIPKVTTSTVTEEGFTNLREVTDITKLAEALDALKLPDQMAAILDNRMLQFMIACDPNETAVARISTWLDQVLHGLFQERYTSPSMAEKFKDLLQKCIRMAQITKAHLPLIEKFLKEYIKTWNGWECEEEIMELLTYVKPGPFEEINDAFLKPLYRIYSISDVQWKAKLILCYTEWFKNWALLDWKRHTERRHQDSDTEVDNLIWLFQGLDCGVDYFQAMQHFINHVDRISAIGLTQDDDHPLLQHAVLSFFEFVSAISITHDIPEIIIPGASLIYRSFFSSSGMAMSRICGIVYQYKRTFEENDRKTGDWVTRHTSDYLDDFNTYVMDICSALWRNTAFGEPKAEKAPFSLTGEIAEAYNALCESRGESANLVLSLTHGGCLAAFSEQFMSEKEDKANVLRRHDGPITAPRLKALAEGGLAMSYMDYRVEFLDYLKAAGFGGLYELLYDCMTSLIKRKQEAMEVDD